MCLLEREYTNQGQGKKKYEYDGFRESGVLNDLDRYAFSKDEEIGRLTGKHDEGKKKNLMKL